MDEMFACNMIIPSLHSTFFVTKFINMLCVRHMDLKWLIVLIIPVYRTRMANWALKCRIIVLITARSFYSYNNILINFGQLCTNSCYTSFNIATLDVCTACEFHQLWAVRPCIYHIFQHLTKWLIFCRNGHAGTVFHWYVVQWGSKNNTL